MRGTWGASSTSKGLLCRDMKKEPGNERHNDIELLKEICLEMPCDSEENAATAAKVRAKIESGDYFVHWDIDSTSSTH